MKQVSKSTAPTIVKTAPKKAQASRDGIHKIILENKELKKTLKIIETASVGQESIPIASTRVIQSAIHCLKKALKGIKHGK